MKKVYICSPLRGDYETNTAKAVQYSREAALSGVLPITPHIYFTRFLNDEISEEREIGLQAGLELLSACDEIRVFGTPTAGMAVEIRYAWEHGIPIVRGDRHDT